jgi:hypothetical protein
MKKFAITTTSESGDHYIYFIEHHEKPTIKELNEWLKINGSDIDEEICYESVDDINEISIFKKL